MQTFYHGTADAPFLLKPFTGLRYSFPYFFGSSDYGHAHSYVKHAQLTQGKTGKVVEFTVSRITYTLDLRCADTHTAAFRNLIFSLQKKHPSVLLQNCIDYPAASLRLPYPVDVVAVFDPGLVTISK